LPINGLKDYSPSKCQPSSAGSYQYRSNTFM
jgi:hypothetical protein